MAEFTLITCSVCKGWLGIFPANPECDPHLANALAQCRTGLRVATLTREEAERVERCFCLVPGGWDA